MIHRTWLAAIYPWAGEYHTVNIGKSGFQFAAAMQVPTLMDTFERDLLSRWTPCRPDSQQGVAQALAIVHAELVIIRPFREGNGRCARVLALLMALQAGLPPLNFSALAGRTRGNYILAIHAAVSQNYEPMTEFFEGVISRTLHAYEK